MRTATFPHLKIPCCGSHSNHNRDHSAWILHPSLNTLFQVLNTHKQKPSKSIFFPAINILPAKSQPLQGVNGTCR